MERYRRRWCWAETALFVGTEKIRGEDKRGEESRR
jgi:hypothetical protein